VAAYRADVEIAVKGGRELAAVSKQVAALGKNIADVNKAAKLQGAIPASINNYNAALGQANATIRASAAGTRVQKQAIDLYVTSLARAEKAERSLAVAIKKRQRELGIKPKVTGVGGGGGGRLGGVASNAIIGGAFPLLFGQGAGAATGGAIGGAVGGLFGGTGGFAGSLLGTLIGDIASKGQVVKKLGEDIGFSAEQTRLLEGAFKRAGSEFDKFEASVQNIRGLSLDIEDQANAIKLVSTLTETFGGEIDKVTNAFTSALESGKVTQATLNQLTSQGIPIQEALAQKYGVSRSAIVAMAKDGKIPVQTLSDVLVDMGNKGLQAGEKPRSAFEQFSSALGGTATAVGNVASVLSSVLGPAIDTIILKATQALNILTETINTELLRTDIQSKSGKIVGPEKLKEIEADAMKIASMRFPSKAQGNQLAAGAGIISPAAQAEFQILREQGIRNELQKFGFESGILKTPTSTVETIGRINAPSQLPPSGDGGAAADKAAKDAARERKRVAELVRSQGLVTAEVKRQAEFSAKIAAAEMAQDPILVRRLQGEQQLVEWGYETANLLEKEQNAEGRLAIAQAQQAKQGLIIQETAQDLAKLAADRLKAHQQTLRDLDTELQLALALTNEERNRIALEAERLNLKDQGRSDQEIEEILTKKVLLTAPGMQIKTFIAESSRQLNDLEAVAIRVSQGIGDAVGNSLANGITGLIEGTATAKEVFANFLRDVGQILVQEGTKMIATYIAIGIAKIFAGMGGGGGGGGNAASALGSNPNVAAYSPLAKGGTFANGIATFAKGGTFSNSIVSSPTLFKFADGGTTRTGLMGEAGPEAIMPLKRGSDGSLGVQATGIREAMGRPPGGANGSPVLNMSFQSTTINGTEYVSRDQLEAAMAATRRQAAKEGANRGMNMTLDKIQNSPSTRSRVGIR
jgi:tape measure domain-containing protein